jgi:hypothetical protein
MYIVILRVIESTHKFVAARPHPATACPPGILVGAVIAYRNLIQTLISFVQLKKTSIMLSIF